MEEKEIIQKVIEGDADSYAYLINRYQIGLIIHCENIVHSRQDGEDIAQEAFIKAFRKLASYDGDKAKFSTWLYKIASNCCIDHQRRHKREVDVEDIELAAEKTAPVSMGRAEKQEIIDVVDALRPPKYGMVIRGYFWEGKSYKQLAEELDTTVSSVGTWMRRAKTMLRKELS